MSTNIKSINPIDSSQLYKRDVNLNGSHVQSVNILQTDGSFITTQPFDNKLVWYPQSPNNIKNTLLGSIKSIQSFSGYGNLYYPMDARFDYIRRILWIADSGNMRLLGMDINTNSILYSIAIGYFTYSINININNGDIFAKSIKDSSTGIIQCYSKSKLNESFEFDYNYGIDGINPLSEYEYILQIPLPSTMVFNHGLNRLWWSAGNFLHMSDINVKNIVSQDMYPSIIYGIDVDFSSGNLFAVSKNPGLNYFEILQISKDNNSLISKSVVFNL